MNYRAILRVLGSIYVFLGTAMLAPAALAFYSEENGLGAFLGSAGICLTVGATLLCVYRDKVELRLKDGFALLTFAWISSSILGALPYAISGVSPNLVHALFESTSGFTTTGATVFRQIEALPQAFVLWRSLTQWIGGMGILIISMAIIPSLGIGGMQLFKSEIPGTSADRLSPRIRSTARILWGVYFGLTAFQIVLLLLGGMGLLDAICLAFSTVSTGGFSPRDGNVGALGSGYFEWVILMMMLLAGANFALHFLLIRGRWRRYVKDEEFRVYVGMIFGAATLLWCWLVFSLDQSALPAIRHALFQATAILSTTGYYTADFQLWGYGTQILLFAMMFVGGCAGSTAGGMKTLRVLLLAKHGLRQLRKLLHPKGVLSVRLSGRAVSDQVMTNILGFFLLYMLVYVGTSLLLSALGLDVLTAFGASIACLSNVGPGLGQVGPLMTYDTLPGAGMLLLAFCMILGRLELVTVLVMLTPMFWRRT